MSWRSVPLDEATILRIVAANEVHDLNIAQDDINNLKDAYASIMMDKELRENAPSNKIKYDFINKTF